MIFLTPRRILLYSSTVVCLALEVFAVTGIWRSGSVSYTAMPSQIGHLYKICVSSLHITNMSMKDPLGSCSPYTDNNPDFTENNFSFRSLPVFDGGGDAKRRHSKESSVCYKRCWTTGKRKNPLYFRTQITHVRECSWFDLYETFNAFHMPFADDVEDISAMISVGTFCLDMPVFLLTTRNTGPHP